MGDIYSEKARARRAPNLQSFLDAFVKEFGIDQDFVDSSGHPYTCTCQKCLAWWAQMGPEDDEGDFGPFAQEDVEAYCKENGLSMWWQQSVKEENDGSQSEG